MPTYYSDHFSGVVSGTNAEDNTVLDEQKRTDPYERHGRMRYSRAEFTGTLVVGDVVRLMTLKSSDCLNHVFITCEVHGSSGTTQIGLHKTGGTHDGALIDANIIKTGIDSTSASAHAEILGGGSPDLDLLRGKPLWEAANLGASAPGYTRDPMENWDVTLNSNVLGGATSATYVIEVYFTSGD